MKPSRAVSVWVVGLMLSASFLGLVAFIPGTARAVTEVFYADADMDGYLYRMGPTYPPSSGGDANDTTAVYAGQVLGAQYLIYRGFTTFDTSSLPDDAVVLSATFRARLSVDASSTDFSVMLYATDFTTWPPGWTDADGTYQGVLLNTVGAVRYSWYSLSVSRDSVSVTDQTQFSLKSSRDGAAPTDLEYVGFSGAASSFPFELSVEYMTGTSAHIQTDGGYWYESAIFPIISEWNLTYDLHYYEIDTVPATKNMTINKTAPTWTFLSIAPACNYTDNSTFVDFSDVLDSTTYRLWFTVPKTAPYCTVHLSLYNAFTGEGFFWEQMRVSICNGSEWNEDYAEVIPTPEYRVEPDEYYTVMVSDYFGNELANQSFLSTAANLYIRMPVPVYSWQVFNMNEMPVLMKIYWEGAGAPWEFFVGPQWIVERFLKGGDYTFMVTFYDSSGTVGETREYDRAVPSAGLNASFIYIDGTTLSEIVTDIEGLQATQEILTSLVTPNMVLVYEDLPLAPVSLRSLSLADSLAIDPYLVLEATTYQNDSGTDVELWLPYPDITGATYYIMSDVLSFAGDYSTDIIINTTDDEELFNSTSLPASVRLDGENVTVWSSSAVSVSRTTTWREVSEYLVTYYPTQKKYLATLSLNNSMAFDYYEPYWFIGFPANTTIALDSVVLYDLDNDLYLSQTAHFTVTSGGVHLTLSRLNASGERNFRISYYDYNSTVPFDAPKLIAYSYTTASYNGVPMKFTAVQWGNPWSVAYKGEIYISLNFTYGDCLKESSIRVVEQNSGRVLTDSEWIYTGRTIIVLTSGVGTVPVGGGVNFGIYWTFDAAQAEHRTDFFFGPIIYNGMQFYVGGLAVSWALLVIIVGWIAVGMALYSNKKDWQALAIIWGCVTIILFLVGAQVT